VADTPDDPDVNPDIVPITGTVTFTPSVKAILVASESVTVVPAPIVAVLDANGYVSLNGVQSVTVLATNSTYYNPNGWTYRVSFDNLAANGRRVTFDPYNIEVPVGSTVDLSSVTPITGSTGTPIVRGPAGPVGAQGPQGNPGPSDTQVATYFTSPSSTRTAADARYARGEVDVIQTVARGLTPATPTPGMAADSIILAAMTEAKNAARAGTGGSDPVGSRVIDLPAGDYTISTLNGLIGAEAMASKVNGLRFRGAGKGLTRIVFTPGSAGSLILNDYWLNIGFTGMTFVTTVSGTDFMRSYTTHNAQHYSFTDCEWAGPWNHVFDLQGDNNNSEFVFINCATTGILAAGAFLYIGATNSSDQFLNYWFYGFKHWSTSAPLVDIARGGSVHIFGLDASDWGAASTSTSPALFNLRGAAHSLGVCEFHAQGVRVEAKSANAKLLYSEWPGGNVSLQADWGSQSGAYTYGDIIKIVYTNVNGPIYDIHDSVLAGSINVAYGVNDFTARHVIRVRDTKWLQKSSPSDVVTYTRPTTNTIDPSVDFVACQGGSSSIFTTAGFDVWDATVSWNAGDMLKPVQKRQLTVRSIFGSPTAGSSYYLNLPVGALVTGMRAFAPAGNTGNGETPSWALKTADNATTVATVTAPGARSAGYNVVTELAVPFLCDTKARAALAVVPTNATTQATYGMVVVEGYW
jgi:hypothetical protein